MIKPHIVYNWVGCTKSNYKIYNPTIYTVCNRTGKAFRKLLKKAKVTKGSTVAALPNNTDFRTSRVLNTTNIYPVLDQVVGIQQTQPGFAVNKNKESLIEELITQENKFKRKLRTSTENQHKK
jgi:hypothetical protein